MRKLQSFKAQGEARLPEVSTSVLESLLETRIDQTIAITLPSEQSRIDLLVAMKNIDSFPVRLASFTDYLIDYAASLSLELNKVGVQLSENKEKLAAISRSKKSTDRIQSIARKLNVRIDNIEDAIDDLLASNKAASDYEEALELVNQNPGNLAAAVNELLQQNLRLQRLHNQDRALLLKQNEMIRSLQGHPNEDDLESNVSSESDVEIYEPVKEEPVIVEKCGSLAREFRQIADELAKLDQEVKHKLRSAKRH